MLTTILLLSCNGFLTAQDSHPAKEDTRKDALSILLIATGVICSKNTDKK